MSSHLGELLFQTFVMALAAEALLRLWGIAEPAFRLRLRLAVVALPVLASPCFELFASFRHTPWFEDEVALFVSGHWSRVLVWGVSLGALVAFGGAALGLFLLLVDALPWLRARRRRRRRQEVLVPTPPSLEGVWQELGAAAGARPPPLRVVDARAPLLVCRGLRRPEVVISTGALGLLDARETRAALAHELGHALRGDLRLGWLLFGARLLQFFNPVLHLVARAVAREAERRADDFSVRLTGDPLALAGGLLRCFAASRGPLGDDDGRLQTLMVRARELSVEQRCRRLLERANQAPGGEPPTVEAPRLLVAATGLALLGLCFLMT